MEMAIFITACAALITGIANIFMVFELKEQKRATSSPLLSLLGTYCNATYKENCWRWDVSNMHGLPLELINYGAGTAYDVSVNWLVEMKELLKIIKQHGQKTTGILNIGRSWHNINPQNFREFDPIPGYDKQVVNQLLIPSYYICAFEEFLDLEVFANETESIFDLPPFPCVMADISYEDINKNLEKKRYKIAFNIISLTGGGHKEINVEIKVKEL
jgi:hypothetical protein